MSVASYLLLVIGLLGAFDVAWFHTLRGRLALRRECRREAWIHVARGPVYAAQFLVVPGVRFGGAAVALLAALFAVDVAVAVLDVLEEPRSRAAQGGLSRGEYLMHIVLSVLVGAMLANIVPDARAWAREPTAVALEAHGPAWLRGALALMAAGVLATTLLDVLALREGHAAPLHVRVRLRAPLERVWGVTQDHRLHPTWDARFSSIAMLHEGRHDAPAGVPDPRIATGTMMRYERRLLGARIRGFGRYKLHRPMRQSTFEFWSDDPRSLIRRGVGLWLYTPRADGTVELSTSYTYEVRWGVVGRAIDRLLFRPAFQWLTERSFARLARDHFGDPRPAVLGRRGRKPEVFA